MPEAKERKVECVLAREKHFERLSYAGWDESERIYAQVDHYRTLWPILFSVV